MSLADNNKKIPKHSFVSRNLVTIVMVPAIIAMHYGWVLLQDNKSLVPENEKMELPIITGAKHLWRSLYRTAPIPDKQPPATN